MDANKISSHEKDFETEHLNSDDDEQDFFENQDEILQEVGIEKRTKFFKAMKPFLEWL